MERSAGLAASAPEVLVVGAGVAGLACARTLTDAGLEVRVADKGRGAGGRVATRRHDGLAFDHGAQYFTVRDARFGLELERWRRLGLARRWRGRIGTLTRGETGETSGQTERWVGVPSMSAIGRQLAAGLEVESGRRVVALERAGAGWTARLEGTGERSAGLVVLALPAPQAAALLPARAPFRRTLETVEMSPCWTVMAAFAKTLPLALDGAFVDRSALAWVARDSSKPGRADGERWVLQATPEWSVEWLEREPEEVRARLLAAFAAAAGRPLPEPVFAAAHRWRYARAAAPLGREYLHDRAARLGACGDWCPGERIEGAWLSGVALAEAILAAETVGTAAGAVRPVS